MNRRDIQRILQFCLLSFGLSWTWWTLRLLPHWKESLLSGIPLDRSTLGLLDVTPGIFAPWIAALLMRWIHQERDLPRPLGLNHNWNQYLLAVAVPVLALMFAMPIYSALGAESFTWAGDNPTRILLSLVPITVLATLTALGEEFGWRGYLLPLLLPLGRTKASLILGVVWGVWHLPILLSGLTYPGQPPLLAVSVFIPSVMLLSFLFTDLFVRSKESVVLAALTHGTLNALSEISSPRHFPGLNPVLANPFGLVIAPLVFIIMVVLGSIERKKQYKSEHIV